jgi:hypothetical protein
MTMNVVAEKALLLNDYSLLLHDQDLQRRTGIKINIKTNLQGGGSSSYILGTAGNCRSGVVDVG